MADFVTGLLIGQAAGRREAENSTPKKPWEPLPPSGTMELLGELTEECESLRCQIDSLQEQNRQSRSAASGHAAVRLRLSDALREVAPDHDLVSKPRAQAEIYNEAAQREWDRNAPEG